LIKLIRDLLNNVYLEKKASLLLLNGNNKNDGKMLISKEKREQNQKIMEKQLENLIEYVNKKLDSSWQWLISLMDATEAQLRFGTSLSASQNDFYNSNAMQYLRHLEERSLLINYLNNSYGKLNRIFLSIKKFFLH
jgi:hypothetical protein